MCHIFLPFRLLLSQVLYLSSVPHLSAFPRGIYPFLPFIYPLALDRLIAYTFNRYHFQLVFQLFFAARSEVIYHGVSTARLRGLLSFSHTFPYFYLTFHFIYCKKNISNLSHIAFHPLRKDKALLSTQNSSTFSLIRSRLDVPLPGQGALQINAVGFPASDAVLASSIHRKRRRNRHHQPWYNLIIQIL